MIIMIIIIIELAIALMSYPFDAGCTKGVRHESATCPPPFWPSAGRVIESRSELTPVTGQPPSSAMWSVSRTIYDSEGKVIASTDRFLVPLDTPLGEAPTTGTVSTQITKTICDDRNRTIATERYTGATVTRSVSEGPSFTLSLLGTLESVSETLYDSAGSTYRTISGRVPLSSLSPFRH